MRFFEYIFTTWWSHRSYIMLVGFVLPLCQHINTADLAGYPVGLNVKANPPEGFHSTVFGQKQAESRRWCIDGETNLKVKRSIKEATEKWIEDQCEDIENSLKHNNSNKAYKIVKELTDTKQTRATTIESKEGKCLTEEKEILERWTEYCSELYTHVATGKDPNVLNVPPSSNNARHSILRTEIIEAVSSLKPGKSAGIDNITGEMVQAGGEATIDMLFLICNKIWQTGVWPKSWTQSLVITLPKKGNLKLCQNYRTISLNSHPSKVMLKVILNRLKPEAEKIIAEEQAGFRPGRSTVEQICNVRILMKNISNTNRSPTMSSLILKRHLTEFGMRPSSQP
ncbi:endonuclease-reverse transcriptase [Plakobranchus ocellatus]|uniref:Endonuclease-reverse transcriptase n=1 Tax=Plakobranchus ocellatus TaxID=259542 RepID=A0AAV4CDD3_9GAST|nr:endonuclease-reverse transcriptase [Plakobranchus ocellatus]